MHLRRKRIIPAVTVAILSTLPVLAYAGGPAANSLPGAFYTNRSSVSYASYGIITVPTGNTIMQWGNSAGMPGAITEIPGPTGVLTNPGFSVGSGSNLNIDGATSTATGNVLVVDNSGTPSEILGNVEVMSNLSLTVANQDGIIIGGLGSTGIQGGISGNADINLAAVGQTTENEAAFASTGIFQYANNGNFGTINNAGSIGFSGSSEVVGEGIVNTGYFFGGSTQVNKIVLTVMPGNGSINGITGSGTFAASTIVINDGNGNINNGSTGLDYLNNGLNIAGTGPVSATPSTNGTATIGDVTIFLNVDGSTPQDINLNIAGSPTLFSNVNTPLNGTSVDNGGSSLIVQASNVMSVNGGLNGSTATNHGDFTFPGGIALVDNAGINVNANKITNAWTSNDGIPFQGVFLDAANININNTMFTLPPKNWVNLSTQPNLMPVAQYYSSGVLTPENIVHQSSYTQLVQAAASGQNWAADVNRLTMFSVGNFLPVGQSISFDNTLATISQSETQNTVLSLINANQSTPTGITSQEFLQLYPIALYLANYATDAGMPISTVPYDLAFEAGVSSLVQDYNANVPAKYMLNNAELLMQAAEPLFFG